MVRDVAGKTSERSRRLERACECRNLTSADRWRLHFFDNPKSSQFHSAAGGGLNADRRCSDALLASRERDFGSWARVLERGRAQIEMFAKTLVHLSAPIVGDHWFLWSCKSYLAGD